MDEKSLFTDFWSKESKTTSKVLSRIPEGSDYRPDPKSRTARDIAWQIVNEEKMIIDALENGLATWAPHPRRQTMKEMCEMYDRQSADIVRRLRALPAGAVERHAGVFRQPTAGVADGVELSCSTSSITAARSPRICVRWDRRFRRSTGRARTSHKRGGRMRYTRREAGKLALTALPAALLVRPLTALAQARPNSLINGVTRRRDHLQLPLDARPERGSDAEVRRRLRHQPDRIHGRTCRSVCGRAGSAARRRWPPRRSASNSRAAGRTARSRRQTESVAHIGVDGSLQGTAQDVQRRGRHDLRVEAVDARTCRTRSSSTCSTSQRRSAARTRRWS